MSEGSGLSDRASRATTHGMSRTSEYSIWNSMCQRCVNPKHKNYPSYGGVGIKVCARWSRFENFFADMGERPSPKHSIDRFPNKAGDYEPGNVRWATTKEQNNNRKSNLIVSYHGAQSTLKQAVERGSSNYDTVRLRLSKGWSVESAIDTPIRRRSSEPFLAQLNHVATMVRMTDSEELDALYQQDLEVLRKVLERS